MRAIYKKPTRGATWAPGRGREVLGLDSAGEGVFVEDKTPLAAEGCADVAGVAAVLAGFEPACLAQARFDDDGVLAVAEDAFKGAFVDEKFGFDVAVVAE